MASRRALQPLRADLAQPDRPSELATEPREIGRWLLGEAIPHVLRDGELMRLLNMKHSAYCRRKAHGEFERFQITPQLPGPTLYSGALLTKWLRGESIETLPTRRYFGKARQARPQQVRRVSELHAAQSGSTVSASESECISPEATR